jgi:hypothetical protein
MPAGGGVLEDAHLSPSRPGKGVADGKPHTVAIER